MTDYCRVSATKMASFAHEEITVEIVSTDFSGKILKKKKVNIAPCATNTEASASNVATGSSACGNGGGTHNACVNPDHAVFHDHAQHFQPVGSFDRDNLLGIEDNRSSGKYSPAY